KGHIAMRSEHTPLAASRATATRRRLQPRRLAHLLLIAGGLACATGCTVAQRASTDPPRDPAIIEAAAAAGVDLRSGPPQRQRDRLLAIFDAGGTVPFETLAFDGQRYLDPETNAPFSGHASTVYPSGRPRSVHGLVAGLAEGSGVWCYEDRRIWMATAYREGALDGQFIAFMPEGWMRLRVMTHGDDREGVSRVDEVCVGSMGEDGRQQDNFGRGRLVMTGGAADPTTVLTHVPLHAQTGFVLRYGSIVGRTLVMGEE
ncbi:MAG: hypothetical protein AAF235_02935, partial [Planctomycetota bacterium]